MCIGLGLACTCLYCNQSCLLCHKYSPQCLGQQLQSIHMIKCIFCTLSVCFSPHTVYFLGSNPKKYSAFWLYFLGLDYKKYSPFPSFLLLGTRCCSKVMAGTGMQSAVLLPKGGQFARPLPLSTRYFIDRIPPALGVTPFLSHFLVPFSQI